jgi:hypothetical protein
MRLPDLSRVGPLQGADIHTDSVRSSVRIGVRHIARTAEIAVACRS